MEGVLPFTSLGGVAGSRERFNMQDLVNLLPESLSIFF